MAAPGPSAAGRAGPHPAGQAGRPWWWWGTGPACSPSARAGFLLDAEFSPQRLSELAKMDGAIILAPDASRIARANVHLMPKATHPDHRDRHPAPDGRAGGPLHRRARPVGVGGHVGHRRLPQRPQAHRAAHRAGSTTGPTRPWPPCSASAAGSTWPSAACPSWRWRTRCRWATWSPWSRPPRWCSASPRRSTGTWSSWARTAAWSDCSPPSWSTGSPPPSTWWSGTTAGCPRSGVGDRLAVVDRVVDQLANLSSDELRDSQRVAQILGLPGSFHDSESGVEPRGYRLLYRLPRFSDAIIERIVERFVNLQQIMRASLSELEQVEGVGAGPGPLGQERVWPAWPRPASSSATSSAQGAGGPPGGDDRGWGASPPPCTIACSLRGPDRAHQPGISTQRQEERCSTSVTRSSIRTTARRWSNDVRPKRRSARNRSTWCSAWPTATSR